MGLLLVGAAFLWGASALTWATTTAPVPGTGAGRSTAQTVGDALAPVLPIAVLSVAGVAAALAFGPRMRRVTGVLLAAAGLVPAVAAVATSGGQWWARAAVVAAGLVVAAGGALLLAVAGRVPGMGSRYAAPGAAKGSARTEDDLWQALSEGQDPTAGGEPGR
ncbi:Trp biosynthesis-associated membrane protein [Actinokineospora bangkokensis]|uniref:Trp biosynthesis-associated membrane protein n=1 Tax=Actinokineospora bangkokensis TaxID=1193682 RepID=UPI000A8F0F64|nr:Trp biosynthesis-associated membrane protein [Actinokineospora bangkokensis]